jgi:hypothetical protein
MTMNPPRRVTKTEEVRKFFAPYSYVIVFAIALVMGYVMGKL